MADPHPSKVPAASAPNSNLMELMRRNQKLMAQIMSGSICTNDMASSSGNTWLFDSSCCNHMTPHVDLFITKHPPQNLSSVCTADNTRLSVAFSEHEFVGVCAHHQEHPGHSGSN